MSSPYSVSATRASFMPEPLKDVRYNSSDLWSEVLTDSERERLNRHLFLHRIFLASNPLNEDLENYRILVKVQQETNQVGEERLGFFPKYDSRNTVERPQLFDLLAPYAMKIPAKTTRYMNMMIKMYPPRLNTDEERQYMEYKVLITTPETYEYHGLVVTLYTAEECINEAFFLKIDNNSLKPVRIGFGMTVAILEVFKTTTLTMEQII
jgi:hypothetical protein